MSFTWPLALLGLLAVPLAVVGYRRLLAARAARAAALAAQGFVLSGPPRHRRVRHVPFAFFLAALALLLVALARPQASVSLPRREGTVVLAFDVSSSMVATDLAPTRLRAAQEAAKRFVAKQPDTIRIGVVAFSDGGLVTQTVTDSRPDVVAAIDRLTTQGGTSLGQGIFTSLSAIAGKPILTEQAGATEPASLDEIEIGYFGSAAIVLLSDGENTVDPDPLAVAELASVAGVNIHTIGIGSPEGTVVEIEGFNVATALDAETLTAIAGITDGTYSEAADPEALNEVYESIDLRITADAERREITGLVAAASALLVFVGATLSLLWFGRVV